MKSVRLSHRSIAVARLVLAGSLAAWAIAGSGAARAQENAPAWDVYGDTWVATDGLGRALPTFEEVGPPRRDRTVAIFYFLWLGQHSRTGPWDITKILAAHPDAMKNANDPAWGPVSHFHHWGEPLYGYYVSRQAWVIRRHADLLAAAGVDAVICDSTNNNIYGKCVLALCRGLSESRRLGNPAPRYAAIGPFGDANRVVAELYDTLYAPGICADSWFRWDGKPLILADPATLLGRQLNDRHDVSRELAPGHTLGQSFAAAAAFDGVGGCFPTWRETGSAMTLTLFEGGPGGRPVVSGRFRDVQDNGWVYLKTPTPLPAGRYYLEMSQPRGRVGWWAARRPVLNGGEAFADGRPAEGGMTLGLQEPGSRI
ncbi:MAG: hypothetical protein M1457_00600, partial [bacterium]|nr:hypothetical protein [bacterium]